MNQVTAMPSPSFSPAVRTRSIDLLRGLIMIIMALDHVRDYFHADAFLYNPTDLSKTSAALFFTRWITHFCAPTFAFLAGVSACMISQRKTKAELSAFLLKRGAWLIFLEFTVLVFGWTFDIAFHGIIFNVIWMLGISMVLLAALIHLPLKMILLLSLLVVAGHNLLDGIDINSSQTAAVLWALLHKQSFFPLEGDRFILIVYPIVPWFAVMALGYCLGSLYQPGFDKAKRKRTLIWIGTSCILLFVVLRLFNLYGDSAPWSAQPTGLFSFLSFLNTSKYPVSLLFLLMTLGPALLFLAFTEDSRGRLSRLISVYGRVPFFYFLVHVYLIHLLAMLAANFFPGHSWRDFVGGLPGFDDRLNGFGFSLGIVYLVWIAVVLALYPLCKWYDSYKQQHKEKWWLSYL